MPPWEDAAEGSAKPLAGPIRCARAMPPSPMPKRFRKCRRFKPARGKGPVQRGAGADLPLPRGEGWGEGERDVPANRNSLLEREAAAAWDSAPPFPSLFGSFIALLQIRPGS